MRNGPRTRPQDARRKIRLTGKIRLPYSKRRRWDATPNRRQALEEAGRGWTHPTTPSRVSASQSISRVASLTDRDERPASGRLRRYWAELAYRHRGGATPRAGQRIVRRCGQSGRAWRLSPTTPCDGDGNPIRRIAERQEAGGARLHGRELYLLLALLKPLRRIETYRTRRTGL